MAVITNSVVNTSTNKGFSAQVANYSALPDASLVPDSLYLVLSSQGTSWLPGSLGGTYYSKGVYRSDGATWNYLGSSAYQATQEDVNAGLITDQFVSPNTFINASKWSEVSGLNEAQVLARQFLKI